MKAIRKTLSSGERLILVDAQGEPTPNMQPFKRFVCGHGWACERKTGNYAKDWLCVIGEQEDDVPLVITEASGSRPGIFRKAVDFKDLFLIDQFWVDASEVHELKVREMRTYEGLTHYNKTEDVFGRVKYLTDTATWPHFRLERPLGCVAGVPDIVKGDVSTGFRNLDQMTRSQKVLVRAVCTELALLLKDWSNPYKSHDELEDHPLIRAAVFAVSMLLRTRPIEGQKREVRNPYPNRSR